MKSITIHGLDDPLNTLIREEAKKQGMSLNKTIKKLLAESLGIATNTSDDHRKDFLDLFGSWRQEEAQEFAGRLGDFEKIDSEDWA